MSNKFKFADKFDFTPPFDFKTLEEQEFDVFKEKRILNQKLVKTGIIWVDDEVDFKKKFGLLKNDPNKFRVFIELKKGIKKQQGQYEKLNDSGILFNDFRKIHGVTLGENLVKAIENENKKKNTEVIINDLFNWLNVRKPREEETYNLLYKYIQDFAINYPSEIFKPEKVYEEFFKLMQDCISLGVIGINDIAKYLSEEVFNALATEIKKLKLEEVKWNPESKDKEGKSNYNPIFKDFSNVEAGITAIFDQLSSFSIQSTQYDEVNSIIVRFGNIAKQILVVFKDIILEPLKALNEYIKKNNAFIVGFINGCIDVLAGIFEGFGFIIGLFNYRNLKEFVNAIQQLVKNFDWSIVKGFIIGELQKLFAFWGEENQYKQAYELGKFFPKLIEIAINIVLGSKTVILSVKKINETRKALFKRFKEVRNMLLFKIDNKILKELKKEGISVNVSFDTNFPLSSATPGIGIPKLEIKNKEFEVVYKGISIKKFNNEKELNRYLKKMKKDIDFEAERFNAIFKDFLGAMKWRVRRTPGGSKIELIDEDKDIVLFRTENEIGIEKYIKYSKLTPDEKQDLLEKMYAKVKGNVGKSYKKEESVKKLRELGYDLDIPISKFELGKSNGVTPDFSVMGESMFSLEGKLGNGDYYKIKGYSLEDINSAFDKIKKVKGIVKVNITSDRTPDFSNCWIELGIEPSLGTLINSKLKLTWHHMDDLDSDLKSSLQLVIREVHEQTTQHMGSHKQLKEILNLVK
ncbi:HNH endonuclease [Tenacibaculum sp. ZS6-P6]|uniref:HNH endonuclease n=1 Tax=Tenacibaculum sp. ZS6-P6 TaxID=3447503 RepID=UPI003F9E20B6